MSNCYSCKHKCNVPGDSHISCGQPNIRSQAMIISIAVLTGNSKVLEDFLNVRFNPHGVQNGWFNYPMNYDPIWMDGQCKLHESAVEKIEAECISD